MDHLWERYGLETAAAIPRDQLLHLLTCQECRQWLIERLLDDEGEEQTQEDLYAVAFRPIEDATLLEAAGKRRRNAEGLLGELLSFPPQARGNLVTKGRFRSLDLLDLLVDLSHSSQPAEPAQAQGLAEMAYRLAAVLGDEDHEAAALLPHALCLGANARRLLHDLGGAEAQLAKAAPFLACAGERAFYCRTAALVRWEEGGPRKPWRCLDTLYAYFRWQDPRRRQTSAWA